MNNQATDDRAAVESLLRLSGLQVNEDDLQVLVQMFGWFEAQSEPLNQIVRDETEPASVFVLQSPEVMNDAE